MSTDTTQGQPDGGAQAPTSSSADNVSGIAASSTLTKNGTISKMRSHRGNVPTLPQTKLCPLCPAKFTRTTHLNRHLKTHTNERLHECDRCHAQFTRSDLLTRHKRTCCDTALANKSRRKSCQSCADSKVKCDLQRPCSRCKTRNRECVYTNALTSMPEVDSTAREGRSSSSRGDSSLGSSPSAQGEIVNDAPSVSQSLESLSTTASIASLASIPAEGSSGSSYHTMPTTATMPNAAEQQYNYQTTAITPAPTNHTPEERAYLSELFSSQMYDNLFSDLFTSSFQKNPTIPGQHFHQDPAAVLTDRLESTALGPVQPQGVYFDSPVQLAIPPLSFAADGFGDFLPDGSLQIAIPPLVTVEQPTPEELNEYLRLFVSIFSLHMPLVHIPTFLLDERHPILVVAMQACGAMYAHTPAAAKFIDTVLASKRDEVIAELSSDSKSFEEIVQLTVASGLMQVISLFHRDPEQRAKANVYHGMIVMMLRMNGFVDKVRDWKLPEINFSDPEAVERAWRGWVKHESAKRAVWLCYLHDCCHAIYFNLSPTFRTEQFTLGLPSEDALWTAKNATEWAAILQTPSPYGSVEVRLCGHYLKALYYYLAQNNPDNAPRPFNVSPFAHLVMIHAIMRKLFEMYLRDRLPFSQPDTTGLRPKINPHFVDRDRAFHVQILLHYWLQSWLNSPDTPRNVPEPQQRFCFNALPFYWLAQVGLVAYQEGLPPFDPEGAYITSHDAKFYLIKKWERHIRKFLASGEQTPTKFWDEVMKIRIESWQAETGFEYDHLLGFFHLVN
ncbi:fungal-specific transcription factor domain-containing protein [Cubamyces menziesii]|nr:fungal-specific transcription factor domain-containing protein [Cubamyces menziesii]